MIKIASPMIGEEEIEAVKAVMESGMLAQGPRVDEFEKAFAAYVGTRHAVATSSGTTALTAALKAAGTKAGDEVIVPSFSFIGTATPVLFNNAKPVFVDVDEKTYNISVDQVKAAVTEKTKAVLPVHLFGQPCNMKPIVELCEEKGLSLIEDAAQAHGAEYGGKKTGSFGIGCFSFYGTKNMTTGEGGMITTDDGALAESIRMFRNHGSRQRYLTESLGYNFRMTDIQAAIGIVQLKHLDEWNAERIENAKYYNSSLETVVTPAVLPGCKHVYHQYTIRSAKRDALKKTLNAAGVASEIYYPLPIHQQPIFSSGSLRVSESLSKTVLSIPVHPKVSEKGREHIVSVINSSKTL